MGLSMSSFPLNKPPVQRTQDSPLHGLASWLPLACSQSQEARTSSSNKQDLSRNHLLHQHLSLRDTRVKPMLEQTLQLGVSLNTNHLLRCSPHLPAPPDDHQPPAPFLLGRHQGLRHLLLPHRLPLLPLQPARLPHPVRPLRGARHLSSPPPLAHRACRPPALLRHILPPPCLRPLPPPALPAQASCSRPAP